MLPHANESKMHEQGDRTHGTAGLV
jgi:hypothetical protein